LRKPGLIAAAVILTFASTAAAEDRADSKKKGADAAAQGVTEAKKPPAESPAASSSSPSTGPDTTTETFGDWSIICAARPGTTDRSCEVSTAIMLRNQTAPFARVAFLSGAKDKPARLLALVPVNVATQSPVRISIDSGKAEVSLPIRSCTPGGCLADAELGKDVLLALKSPAKSPGQLTVVDATGKAASVTFSLRGLDDALEAYLRQQDK